MNDRDAAPADFDFTAARALLERFMELGERHQFHLVDGPPFEGWVVEVGERAVLVMLGGPAPSEDAVELSLASIELGTLRYLDEGTWVAYAAS